MEAVESPAGVALRTSRPARGVIARDEDRQLFGAIGSALSEMRRVRDADVYPLSRESKQRGTAPAADAAAASEDTGTFAWL